jgi:hypothetical protein
MQVRLATLQDMAPAARVSLRATATVGRSVTPRNAEDQRITQWRLKQFVDALVAEYDYRPGFRGSSPPWSVPYIPLPFAGEMIAYFEAQAKHWLGASVPDGAKQPGFIKNWTKRAAEIVGQVRAGVVETPNLESYEEAPSAVAGKAPKLFKADRPAGLPHPRVLKADASWRFLDALIRLAIHYDVLRGQPTKLDIFAEALAEQAASVADSLAALPGKVTHFSNDLLKWGAIAVVSLGALYAVTR